MLPVSGTGSLAAAARPSSPRAPSIIQTHQSNTISIDPFYGHSMGILWAFYGHFVGILWAFCGESLKGLSKYKTVDVKPVPGV